MLIQQFGIDIMGVNNKTTVAARVLSIYLRYATPILSVAWMYAPFGRPLADVELVTAPPTPPLCDADSQRRLDVLSIWLTSRTCGAGHSTTDTLVMRR